MKYWREVLIIVLGLVVLSMAGCYRNQLHIAKQNDRNIVLMKDSFNLIITKDGAKIYQQEQIITDKNSEIAKLIIKVSGLKKINQQIKIKTTIRIDSIQIPIDRPVYITVDSNFYLKVPIVFSDTTNKWYGFKGVIGSKGAINIDRLYMNSEPMITIGYKKKAFKDLLKKDVPLVTYQDKNPYTTVTNMSNIKIEDSRKKNIGIGVSIGYGITKNGLSPSINIGINYNIIKF